MLGRLDLRRAARERVRAVLEVRDAHRRVERVVLGEEQRRADVLEPVEDRELGGLQALRARLEQEAGLCDAMLCYDILYYNILCYTMLCYTILYCTMLCYAIL